jgi:hypothetical protein
MSQTGKYARSSRRGKFNVKVNKQTRKSQIYTPPHFRFSPEHRRSATKIKMKLAINLKKQVLREKEKAKGSA